MGLRSIFDYILTAVIKYAEQKPRTKSSTEKVNLLPSPQGNPTLDVLHATVGSQGKQLDRMYELMLLGFIIILVMVAGLVLTVVLDYKNSADELHQEQYEFLEQQIQSLKTTPTPIPTITAIPTSTKSGK